MNLLGDDRPSCPICGEHSCVGFITEQKPFSLQWTRESLRDHQVQSAHEESEDKDVKDKSPNMRITRKSKNRAHWPALDTAHHPAGDRDDDS